jgi:hypothetical protein
MHMAQDIDRWRALVKKTNRLFQLMPRTCGLAEYSIPFSSKTAP